MNMRSFDFNINALYIYIKFWIELRYKKNYIYSVSDYFQGKVYADLCTFGIIQTYCIKLPEVKYTHKDMHKALGNWKELM